MDLGNIDLLSLQPSYLQKDRFVQVLCSVIEPYFQQLADEVKLCYIYGRIEELNEEVIDSLAWQFHVDFYDYTLPLSRKSELVKKSRYLHKKKGTPAAVEEACKAVFGRTKLKEWFEYEGKPFFFKIYIDITGIGASPEQLKKVDRLIEAYKNKRSWCELISIYYTTFCTFHIGSVATMGEEITVYPPDAKDIITKEVIKVHSAPAVEVEEITVYPG